MPTAQPSPLSWDLGRPSRTDGRRIRSRLRGILGCARSCHTFCGANCEITRVNGGRVEGCPK
eukprot:7156847-Pyramimonas_sp.AAC.1